MLASASDDPDEREWARNELESLLQVKRKGDKYGLNWSTEGMADRFGKEKSLEALETHFPYFTRRADLDVQGAKPNMDSPHMLIEGDNLHALTVLRGTHTGRVDLIYIDPPYNTGKEFTYNDNFIDPENPYRHSAWLDFMWRRLKVTRGLLAETGVVMISIDDNEQANLKLLCDEVFGESNFIAPIIWQGGRKNDSRFLSNGHEYILVYVKNKDALIDAGIKWREPKGGVEDILAAGRKFLSDSNGDTEKASALLKAWFKSLSGGNPAKASSHYCNVEASGRVFFTDNISWPGGGGPTYPVMHPVTGKPCKVPQGGWRFSSPERMSEMVASGRIHFGKDHETVPTVKRYLDETSESVAETVFVKDRRAANKELSAIIGKGAFDFPKDPKVLARWFKIFAPNNAVVLDFFAGSGTTGHAVAALNAEDGGTRQAIMVTLDENGICQEVARKRMEAVLTGKWADGKTHASLPGSLAFYQASGMAELPEFTGSTVDWEKSINSVVTPYIYESVLLANSAWTPVYVESPSIRAAKKANGDVVAVWLSSFIAGDILEDLSQIGVNEEANRTVLITDSVLNNAGGTKSFSDIGWSVDSYPEYIASTVNRARGHATAER